MQSIEKENENEKLKLSWTKGNRTEQNQTLKRNSEWVRDKHSLIPS